MKKYLVLLLFAAIAFGQRNTVDVDQFRYTTIEWSGAETITADSTAAETSDAFYIGDGNLQPEVLNFFIVQDVASDSFFYAITLLLSNDGTNYTTTGTTVVSTDTLTGDDTRIVNFTGTSVPFARFGKLVIDPVRDDSTSVIRVQRGAVY